MDNSHAKTIAQTSVQKSRTTLRKPDKQQVVKKQTITRTSRTRAPPQPKELDVSVTISVGSDDIPIQLLEKVNDFLQKECILGLCSIKRGGTLSRIHLQMVCHILATSTTMINKRIKVYLGWDDAKKALVGHHIHTKTLCNTGLHMFIGMLGTILKIKVRTIFRVFTKMLHPNSLKKVLRSTSSMVISLQRTKLFLCI